MMEKYILKGRKPVPCQDPIEWADWFSGSNRVVRQEKIGNACVSTVFLSIDHQFGDGPPLLFETMIFGGDRDGDTWRYSTWEEPEAGHAAAVALLTG